MASVLGRRRTRVTIAALAAVLVTLPAIAAVSRGAATPKISCAYVEAGAPGPAGNVLRIEDESDSATHIYRHGDEIVVSSNAEREQTACSGGTPTVLNVDQIQYRTTNSAPFFDYIGGKALAPGATPESSGSEIEVLVEEEYEPAVLNVGGTGGDDSIAVGLLSAHEIGVNTNAQADGSEPDADFVLVAAHPSEAYVRIVGKGGNDTITGMGGPEFIGPAPADRLALSGGLGNDTLIGSPHDDRLRGDTGNDVLIGGKGHDLMRIGPGRDLARGGPGPDRIEGYEEDLEAAPDRVFGGAGNDTIDVAQHPPLDGDSVDCGPGHHDVARVNGGDHHRNCEKVEVEGR
jgi:Ca2+-binding RTX toxin-like protein